MCVICQKSGGKLRTVAYIQTGKNMLHVANKLTDKSFFIHLSSNNAADEAIANNVKYHLTCWVLKQREAKLTIQYNTITIIISDIEIINIIENELRSPSDATLNMNNINLTYQNLLSSNGQKVPKLSQIIKGV